MEKLNKNNARLGARISKNGKTFFIYKINDKSFYCGEETYVVIMAKWDNREKGTTWKIFMEQNKGIQAEYSNFILEKIPLVPYEKDTQNKKLLSSTSERELIKLYNRYAENSNKSYMHIVDIGKETFKIVAANKDKQVLISFEGNFVFFDITQDKYTKWREIKIGGSTEIPWPKKTIGELK